MQRFLATAVAFFALLTSALGDSGAPTPTGDSAQSIAGVYLLYRWEDQAGLPVRKMVITARTGPDFSVRGLDQGWSGEGRIEGNEGFYLWVFATGERGKTTFTVNSDGSLKGEVRGEIAAWTYLARRSPAAAEKH